MVKFQAELNLNIFVVCNAVDINSKCGQNYWLLHDNSYGLEQNQKKTLKIIYEVQLKSAKKAEPDEM